MKQARPHYGLEFFSTSFPERRRAEWYKWEFLRRNPKYREDYKSFMSAHGAWLRAKGYWYDLTKRPHWKASEEKYFYGKIAPEIVRLCVKWQTGDLHPPHWRFKRERDSNFRPEKPSGPATGFAPELNWDLRLLKELWERGFTGTGGNASRSGHLLIIEFDLNWPMRDLIDCARQILPCAQYNYNHGLQRRGGHLPTSRRRFIDYDMHLKVWDLKQKRKRLTEIADLVFSSYSRESALARVRDHLKAAEKLISSRYREIR